MPWQCIVGVCSRSVACWLRLASWSYRAHAGCWNHFWRDRLETRAWPSAAPVCNKSRNKFGLGEEKKSIEKDKTINHRMSVHLQGSLGGGRQTGEKPTHPIQRLSDLHEAAVGHHSPGQPGSVASVIQTFKTNANTKMEAQLQLKYYIIKHCWHELIAIEIVPEAYYIVLTTVGMNFRQAIKKLHLFAYIPECSRPENSMPRSCNAPFSPLGFLL